MQGELQSLNSTIQQIPAFSDLSKETINLILGKSRKRQLQKGDLIWQKGEPARYCLLLLSGHLDIIVPKEDGENRIIGIFGPGDVIGLSALLAKSTFPGNAEIISKSAEVLLLYLPPDPDEIHPSLQRDFEKLYRALILKHEQLLFEKLEIVSAGNLNGRLVRLFDHLKKRFAKERNQNNFCISAPLTKTHIAKLIEMRVETVIRRLNTWEKSGYLEMNCQGINLRNFESLKHKDT